MTDTFNAWVDRLPKAELHVHIDGTLQPHRLLSLAAKNNVSIPYTTPADIVAACEFKNLQGFLDLYYLGASVIRDEEDFYALMMDYLLTCKEHNIVHTEIMVEPQTYAPYGVSLATMLAGFDRAITEAHQSWGQSVFLILSFLRHLSEQDALQTLAEAGPFQDQFVAIGLASAEIGNPPEKFTRLFARAKQQGLRSVAHAGEEGPPQYIWDSLDLLKVDRIDHGVRAFEDEALVRRLVDDQIPLTVCPLSNISLNVFEHMHDHNILKLLESGAMVTVNSDDPAYFGGYLNENYYALNRHLDMSEKQAIKLVQNSFRASFLSEQSKRSYLVQLDREASLNPTNVGGPIADEWRQ